MNRERAKELLPIFEAYANGEDIQFDWNVGALQVSKGWLDAPEDHRLDLQRFKYRIKPSPREFWINPKTMTVWLTEGSDNNCIKVREVL